MEGSSIQAGADDPRENREPARQEGGVASGIARALKSGFRDLGVLDPRSLAFFRIMLGSVIVLDVALRLIDLQTFYTDFGVLPRSVVLEKYSPAARFSLLMSSGAGWFQALMLLITAVSGACLAAGYRTRLFAVISWVLLVSIQHRNPLIIQGGDVLFRIMVLFAAILPVDRVWTVGAGSRTVHQLRPSFLHFAYVAQVACVYIVTGAAKYKNAEWRSGLGLPYVLWLQQYTTWLGDLLGSLPLFVLRAMNAGVLAAEILLPILLFVPWKVPRLRAICIAIMMGFHLAILVTLKVGLFSLLSITAWMPLLPKGFWETLFSKLKGPFGPRVLEPEASPALLVAPAWQRMCKEWIGVMFLAYLLVWNSSNILPLYRGAMRPDWLKQTALFLGIDQSWEMFSRAIAADGWFMIPAVRADGSLVDLFAGVEYTGPRRPESLSAAFPGDRWRKYWRNFLASDRQHQRMAFGRSLCRRSSQDRDLQRHIEALQIIYIREPIGVDGSHGPPEKILLWKHECKPGMVEKWEKTLPFDTLPFPKVSSQQAPTK